mgnify:CR=1 FL=1
MTVNDFFEGLVAWLKVMSFWDALVYLMMCVLLMTMCFCAISLLGRIIIKIWN